MAVVRAPGKVMLFGEYAVVEGPPHAALVAAVDRYATCEWEAGGAGVRLVAADLEPPAGPGDARLAFLDAALAQASVRPAGRYVVGSGAFFTGSGAARHKLGLGSSAAVTVALVGALHAAAGEDPEDAREAIFAEARAAHRAASGGGSGADVAACTFGGVVRCAPTAAGGLDVAPVAVPFGLHLVLKSAGASADTRQLLARVRGLRTSDPATWAACMTQLDAARRQAETALAGGEAIEQRLRPGGLRAIARPPGSCPPVIGWAALAAAVRAGREAMDTLAAATGVALSGPEAAWSEAAAQAALRGAALKTTGAGGGDLYWLAPESAAAEAALAKDAATGASGLVRLGIAPRGVHRA